MPATIARPTLDDVQRAAKNIQGLAKRTPVLTSHLFNEASGVQTFFKCENLQRGGSFKIRGALNFLMSLSEGERRRGVVASSSGNHAQAVAMAAAHLDVGATIVMPTDAPKAKLASTRRFSPKIVFFDRLHENREELTRKIAAESGAVMISAYDDERIVAGQATATLELLNQQPSLDAVLTPLGGGGLLSGAAIVAHALNRDTRVFGVEPALANDWSLSLKEGKRVHIAPPTTIADGLRTPMPGEITFPIVRELVEEVLLVTEEEITATMAFLLSRMKILTEPSGAVAAAAVLHRKLPKEVKSAGVILSGGNIDFDLLAEICSRA
jgi:threonine dehydratase